ncbi:CBS domain-containing protein [Microbulbifer halophilus]|uniref:CBS domain-containing protein n=1 Tax=Microbulbifer halophilus TaxID=453963 RepID=A0ABW5EAK6_9GAMM|nr:CBS domain-containing protein [Microbulbifer halophilus]MCW8125717.1 CBS domain-containing protein [Microbulbifer halophilus]
MKVREAMHQGCTWCAPETPLSEVAKILRDEDIGAVPVGENDKLVGIVTDRDIACRGVAEGEDLSSLTAREVMTEGIAWCWEDDDMDTAMHKMEEQQLRRMPVMNSEKRLVGVLSLGDISHSAGQREIGEFASSISAHH